MPLQLNAQPEAPSTVPIEACQFNADFKPGKPEGKTVPFTALARTGAPVPHWYWGQRCLHDFSGMESAESLPVDYCHNDQEVLGVLNSKTVTPEGLQVSGVLTPFTEHDRASEVIFKAGAGVPYQGSIYFDPFAMVVEDVPAGFSAEVNGTVWPGPLTIFRKWSLLGFGVCPHGVDDGTNVKFARHLSGQTAAVTRFSKGETPMTAPTTTDTPPATDPKHDAKPADDTKKPATTPEAEAEVETDPPAKKPATETPPAGTTELSHQERGKAFITAFGADHGPKLFTQFASVQDAQGEYNKILRAENQQLREANAKFAKAPQGETPVSFSGGAAPTVPTKFSNLGDNLGRFAAGIKLPK